MKKAIEIQKQFTLIGNDIKIPWDVYRAIGLKQRNIEVNPGYYNMGEDFVNLEEARIAIDWLVDQFGGEVKWKK